MFKAPKGVRDILPPQSKTWRSVENTIQQVLEDFGFDEIRLPVFESSELFTRSIGTETDIVAKEMYSFTDRGDRNYSLRPEGTASAVRAYLEHQLYTPSPYRKLYYSGPMFRSERPQAGRYRQFFQIGAEAFGVDSPYLDAEILVMLKLICQRLNLTEWELQLNSVGCPVCRSNYRQKLQDYLQAQVSFLCEDCQRRSQTNPMRVFDCKSAHCQERLAAAPRVADNLGDECREHFEQVKNLLAAQGIEYKLNPNLVRGLDYYTRTAFELVSTKLGAQNAFAGGGRYDGLVEEMGGPSIPAIGFAIGMDRLVSLLEERLTLPENRPLVYLILLGEQAQCEGYNLLLKLRTAGIKCEMDYQSGGMKSQMKKADKMQAEYCLILGETELKEQNIILRQMQSGQQQTLKIDDLLRVSPFGKYW
ncbi:MAG: histidine--tRNA ligase [Candidatus Schekmanbacteria bacterium]|nr:histidine--tRNA ligase [Candidatus Schekmanbacteria bacterium]